MMQNYQSRAFYRVQICILATLFFLFYKQFTIIITLVRLYLIVYAYLLKFIWSSAEPVKMYTMYVIKTFLIVSR